ncbi:MAG TPA: DUF4247 domain-containing protein [Acidimicrobiales bacterium]|nr:DUF4247 domain-containing protein [Acidimicrobiales bacterium]
MSRRVVAGRGVLAVALALVLLAACSGGGGDSLRDFASKEYTGSDGRYSSPQSVSAVAAAFTKFRRPVDRHETEGRVFLQYSDDIVAIAPATASTSPGTTSVPGAPTTASTPRLPTSGGRTTIEIDGARTGRQRHFFFIGNRWGRYQSYTDVARGGGPGSGK